jgi:hypothetical protein
MFDAAADEERVADFELDAELANLLDEVFVNAVPIARRLLRLIEQRGWTGWTKLERVQRPLGAGPICSASR